jgi:hypothetical protein
MFDKADLEKMLDENILAGSNAMTTRSQYVTNGARQVREMLENDPNGWRLFGAYYPGIQAILLEHEPDFHQPRTWNDGQPPPDFLSGHDYGDDALNLFAGLLYISGDYLPQTDSPHSIVMPDGSEQLYIPGVGLIDAS